jgi:hypothetical protein
VIVSDTVVWVFDEVCVNEQLEVSDRLCVDETEALFVSEGEAVADVVPLLEREFVRDGVVEREGLRVSETVDVDE